MYRILVIEDEKAVIENIIELLETEDYIVYGAENGKVGVEKAIELLPDLIICDIMMPIMNGIEVVNYLRSNTITSDIPFIFLSAKSEYNDRVDAIVQGADDFLTKPFTPNQLFDTITARLFKHSKIKEPIQAVLDQFKKDLAVIIPHELRTPLNGIKMTIQLLQSSYQSFSDEEIQQFFGMILESANRIENLSKKFELFIELEKIEMGDSSILKNIDKITYDTDSIINEQALQVAKQYNRESDLKIDVQSVSLPIYHKHTEHLLKELIDNAFKFSYPGQKVEVSLKLDDKGYHLIIFNEGLGLDKNLVKELGNIQYNRKQNEQQGLGLGLAIVKKIININNLRDSIDCRENEYFRNEIIFPLK